jgi:hypothetical protein
MIFRIISKGIVYMTVCTNSNNKKDIEEFANTENPTGINNKWKISKDKKFHTGETNPCLCEKEKGFKHYLLNC